LASYLYTKLSLKAKGDPRAMATMWDELQLVVMLIEHLCTTFNSTVSYSHFQKLLILTYATSLNITVKNIVK